MDHCKKRKFFGENKTMEYDTSIWKVKDQAVCDFSSYPNKKAPRVNV